MRWSLAGFSCMEEGRRRSVYIPHSLGVCCLLREKCNLGPKSFYAIRNKFKRIQVKGVIHQHSQYLECHFGMSYATWTSIPALTISYHPQLSAQLASTTHFSPLLLYLFIYFSFSLHECVCACVCVPVCICGHESVESWEQPWVFTSLPPPFVWDRVSRNLAE